MNVTEIAEIVSQVEYPGFEYRVFLDGGRPILQIACEDRCSVTGESYRWKGRKWFLSPHMTRSEIVQTAFLATHVAIEHEARERFKYRGHPVFRLHFSVEALLGLCEADQVERRPLPGKGATHE